MGEQAYNSLIITSTWLVPNVGFKLNANSVRWGNENLSTAGCSTFLVLGPVTVYFEEAQWKALMVFTTHNRIAPTKPPSLLEAIHRGAALVGFLGRDADVEPGTQSVWLGLPRLDDIAPMWQVIAMRHKPPYPAYSTLGNYQAFGLRVVHVGCEKGIQSFCRDFLHSHSGNVAVNIQSLSKLLIYMRVMLLARALHSVWREEARAPPTPTYRT